MIARRFSFVLSLLVPLAFLATPASADSTAQTLPFSQNWTNIGLITADDNWTGVPGIQGFRGDALTGATGTDPQTLIASDTPGVLDVNANQTNPTTFATGGATEFHITNPVVGLTGSGTADAPYLKFYLNTTGQSGITISYVVRDLDASVDDAIQQVALQFRVGNSGNFTNVPAGYIADATTANAATLVTPVCAVLPAAANNQALVEVRVMTTNAAGNDEYIGIDDIVINTATCVVPPNLTITDVSQVETNGSTTFTFQVNLSAPAGPGPVNFEVATADGPAPTASAGTDYVTIPPGTPGSIAVGNSSAPIVVTVNGDVTPEVDENFVVNITNVTGANVTDGQGLGTIENDDASCADLSIDNVTQVETNGGTTTFAFTVSLSQDGCGAVQFDIATADGTAQDDNPGTEDFDYVPQSLSDQTITWPATSTFNVLVNGDTTPESDQTFFVNIAVDSPGNVTLLDGQGLGTILNDDFTRIHDIQGNGAATPIPTATVTIAGVVTGDFQPIPNDNRLSGFFVQEEDVDADADPMTSEGIFIFCSACPTNVAEGQKVQVTGVVSEFNNLTEITATTAGSVVITNAGNNLAEVTASTIDLPVVGVIDDFYEPKESMLVTFVDTLTISEYFEQARYGRIELYEGTRPRTFNESNPPSVAGFAAHNDNLNRRRVYLDDDDNVENSVLNLLNGQQFVFHPQANGGLSVGTQGTDFFRGGDTINALTGILHFSFSGGTSPNEWRVRPVAASPAAFTTVNARPATPPAVGGAIRAASVNVLNYFTTLDVRGADSVAELNRQRERTSIVLCGLNADVAALMEIENHATNATITDLLGAVNTLCGGAHPYTFVNTGGALGTDQIRVLLIYRTGVLSPVGPPLSDTDPIHNRPPTAQTFDVVDALNPAFGQRFTALANHSKSKGCGGASGADLDQNDGQACFAATRLAQANRIISWVNGTVIPAAGDPDVLMLGDFNAYPQETSSAAISGAGFSDLETAFLGAAAYSYLFDGQIGHIDYAWSSASLTPQVTGVAPWHINADENPLFDYNDEIDDGSAEQAFEEKPDGSALVPPRVLFQPASAQRASDHDPVLLGLFQVADVSLTKTLDTAGPYSVGQSVTYTLDVANAGPDPATNIQVTDTPTNLSITSVSGSGCAALPCTIASINAGSNTTITVTATIVAAGAFDNSADANGAEGDPNTANNTDNTGNGGTALSADVSITKTLDTAGPYYPGQSLTYTIIVANAGPSTATNINVTDTPANLTITSVNGACASFSPCVLSSINAGADATINVTATIDADGAFDNSATATADEDDPNTANNTDNTGNGGNAAAADVSLTKTLDTAGPYYAGTSVTYTIVVANAGPLTATNIDVTDTPSNLTITNVSGACASLPCTIAALASGANTNITVTATINSAGAFDNSADANAAVSDPNSSNNTDNTGNGGTAAASANVSITKTLDTAGPYYAGNSVIYTITVANAGPSTATNIGVTDTPSNLTITNVSGACASFSPCTIASLASGANTNITVTATIDAAGVFDNSATATADENDPNTANNTDNTGNGGTATSQADVSLTKTLDTAGPYNVGQSVTYTIVVANAGPSTATSIDVTDTPSNLTITSVSGACVALPCTIASLASGANTNITVTATIDSVGAFDNSATATADETDPNTANNTDNAGSSTNTAADVSISKTLNNSSPYFVGETVTFTLDVANAGPSTATNIQVTDTPTNLTITSVSGGGCAALPCTLASLASGSNVQITVNATIDAAGAFDNSASANGDEFDPNSSNNTDNTGNGDTATLSADVSIVKTLVTSAPYNAGQTITYTLDVANAGPSTATTVQVTDTPTNLTITNVSGGGCAALPCAIASIASGSSVTITITATIDAAGAFDNSASANGVETDPNLSNNTDNTGNGGTASALADSDGDGVPDTIEQAAPNGGDGNGDGIPDSLQNTVASLPAATGSGYLTLQSSCELQEVYVTTPGALPTPDPGFHYPHGLIAFRAPCSSATFSLFVYGSGAVSSYRKYGPLPPGGPAQWYQLPGATFQVVTVGSLHPRRIDFSLTDGGTGDDTPVDGVIVDQGGPSDPALAIPTLDEIALLALAAMLAAIALLVMKR